MSIMEIPAAAPVMLPADCEPTETPTTFVFSPGDEVQVRIRLESEDDLVQVGVEGAGIRKTFWVARAALIDRHFVRGRVLCDAGTMVQVYIEGSGRNTYWIPRSEVVKVT